MLKSCLLYLPQQKLNSTNNTCGEIVCQSEFSFFIVCKVCDIKIFDYEEFIEHFRTLHWSDISSHDIKVENNLNENCDIDDTRTANAKTQPLPDQTSEEEDLRSNKTEEEDFQLHINEDEECNQNQSILRKVTKTKDKQFECSVCLLKFNTKFSLSIHVRQQHSAKEYQRKKCEKSNVEKRYHKLRQRAPNNKYSCKQCEKTFEKYEALRYHLENHIETRDFICDYEKCRKTFPTKRRLSAHKRNHYAQPTYICEICGSRQRSKGFLAVHIRTHTGEKPYACTLCDRRFASKHFLTDHKAVHATDRPYVCKVCGKTFAGRKSLYHHSYLHSDVKNFVCKICKRAYAQAAGLSAHMRKHKSDSGILVKNTSLLDSNEFYRKSKAV